MKRVTFALVACVVFALPSAAEDWPRWRGVRGDGSWSAPALPEKWPTRGLEVIWKQPVGGGYAGVTVAEGRVYTMDLEEPRKKTQEGPDGTERVLCFDAATGKPLWKHTYPVRYRTLGGYANGPRTSPTIHDGRVYALGAVGHLFCFDAKTGDIIWQHDTVAKFGARVPEWGFAGSPVIDGDNLIVHLGAKDGGGLIAFDRKTGKEVWRAIDDPAGYCTPVVIEQKSGKQVVIWTPENVHGVAAATGKHLWKLPYKVTYGVSIAPPVFRDGIVFVTGYWEGRRSGWARSQRMQR